MRNDKPVRMQWALNVYQEAGLLIPALVGFCENRWTLSPVCISPEEAKAHDAETLGQILRERIEVAKSTAQNLGMEEFAHAGNTCPLPASLILLDMEAP